MYHKRNAPGVVDVPQYLESAHGESFKVSAGLAETLRINFLHFGFIERFSVILKRIE